MRTTHLLRTGTVAVLPRQEVLRTPRQERATVNGARPRPRHKGGPSGTTKLINRATTAGQRRRRCTAERFGGVPPSGPRPAAGPSATADHAVGEQRPAEPSVPVTTLGL